jgi:ParB family chromosome partitioning protein
VTPPTSSTPVPTSDPAATLRKADGISASLADDLRATRQHILRAHLAADFEVAFDAMLYALCEQALGRSYNNEALDISIRPFQAQDREVLHADTVAQKMLEALEQDLATDWMKLEKPEDFRVMSALPLADKQALFAWATGLAVKPQLSSDNRPSPIIEEIGARLDVDVAACWRPTAQNYWGRVNKGHAVATALKLISEDYAEDRNRERKGDIAAAMERAFAETADETEGFGAATVAKTTRWLPDGMAFAGAMDADADMGDDVPEAEEGDQPASDTQIDAENDEPSSLPAFLSGDAA